MRVQAPTVKHPSPLRRLREARGLSREQLGVAAGLSSSTLGLAERFGHLTDESAIRLARVLGCAPADLMTNGRQP